MKHILYFLLLIVSNSLFAQDRYLINISTEQGRLNNIYIYNQDGIFKLNTGDELEYVIIGDYHAQTDAVKTIKLFERELTYFKYLFTLDKTDFYTSSLTSINYPDEYSTLEEEFKNLPTEINAYPITYYNGYYENLNQKGKIKSIGKTTIKYYTEYYSDDKIKGKVKQIGQTKIELMNDYVKSELNGFIVKLNDIPISYYYEYYENYLNGKLKTLGNYKFKYFSKYGNDSRNGKFKEITGKDLRFTLIFN